MKTDPEIGREYILKTAGGFGRRWIRVRVTGRVRGLWITEGVEDKRRRDVSSTRLMEDE